MRLSFLLFKICCPLQYGIYYILWLLLMLLLLLLLLLYTITHINLVGRGSQRWSLLHDPKRVHETFNRESVATTAAALLRGAARGLIA